MKYIQPIIDFLNSHGTKVLGFLQGSIAAIAAVDGIIPANQLKYWMASMGLLTFWRGFVNTRNQQ